MSGRLSEAKRKYSLFGSLSIRGAGNSIRIIKSVASKTFGALSEKFIYTSARSYGAMSIAFGLLSLFLYLGKNYFLPTPETNLASLIIGIAFSIAGIPLIFFDKPMCIFLQDFPLTDYIFFEFFSIKRMDKVDSVKGFTILPSVIIGFVPAVIGAFLPPLYVVSAIAVLIFISVAIGTPEFPVIFALLIAPYLSPIPDAGLILASLSLLAFVSFGLKVAIGKRVYRFEIYDALLLLLSILFLVGGIINKDVNNALVMISLTLCYIPASNIIINRRLADCAVNALVVSSVPISVIAIVEYVLSLFGKMEFSAKTIFINGDSYAAFLFLALAFSFCYAKEKKNPFKKTLYFSISALTLVNIILAWQIGLWFTTLVSALAYLVIRSEKIRKEFLLLLIVLPYLFLLLPNSFFADISEFLALSPALNDRFAEWKQGFELFLENSMFGLGFGTETPPANTFLALALNFGVFVFAIVLIIFVFRLIQLSEYGIYMRNSLLALITKAGALAIFGLVSLGMSVDIFSDITIYFLFISVLGILSASLRISRNEYVERLSYYGDQRSADSSDINVRLSR